MINRERGAGDPITPNPPPKCTNIRPSNDRPNGDELHSWYGGAHIRAFAGTNVAIILAVTFLTYACAAPGAVVEDWSRMPAGSMGRPSGWHEVEKRGSTSDMTVVNDAGRRGLQLKSINGSMILRKDIRGTIDLKKTPILEWSWKAIVLPKGGDLREQDKADMAVQLYVVWPRFPELVASRAIAYVWDTTAPQGTIVKRPKGIAVMRVVVRSGSGNLGNWVTERRNISEDFKILYGEYPDDIAWIFIAINSDKTNSTAESYMGAIVFRAP